MVCKLIGIGLLFILWFDALKWHGSVVSQLNVAPMYIGFTHAHMKKVKRYQMKGSSGASSQLVRNNSSSIEWNLGTYHIVA